MYLYSCYFENKCIFFGAEQTFDKIESLLIHSKTFSSLEDKQINNIMFYEAYNYYYKYKYNFLNVFSHNHILI